MVGASKQPRVATLILTYGSAAMAASIEQAVHLPGLIAHHDHGHQADTLEAEVAGVRHLREYGRRRPNRDEVLAISSVKTAASVKTREWTRSVSTQRPVIRVGGTRFHRNQSV